MSFLADKQTLDDLNLTGRYKPDSIFSLFNRVHTAGGEKWLDALFLAPLTDAVEINKRSGLLQYFQRKALVFPLESAVLTVMEGYLSAGQGSGLLGVVVDTGRKKLMDMILRDEGFSKVKEGLEASVSVLKVFHDLVCELEEDGPFGERVCEVKTIFHDRRLSWLRSVDVQELSWWRVARYDHVLRSLLRTEMETLMGIIYEVDVYIAVAGVAAAKGFCYAEALPVENAVLRVQGVRHPRLDKGVGNTVSLSSLNNMLFLTGANMAGKSTLMKSIGIAIYLAHMGFPVAAKDMVFSVRDGLYSSINVPDNLNMGYSHFYAEVLRVKSVAEAVSQRKNMLIIFD
jgi:DNA mismatch repair ATPase MutS